MHIILVLLLMLFFDAKGLKAKISDEENIDKNLEKLKYNWQVHIKKKSDSQYYTNLEINKIKKHFNLEKGIDCKIEFNSFSVVINKKVLDEERMSLACNLEGKEVKLDKIACYDVILNNEKYKLDKGGIIFSESEVKIICYSK